MSEAAQPGLVASSSSTKLTASGAPPARQFSLKILHIIKSVQLANGLKHNDYERYRRYCTRRLHRIRASLKYTHGRSKFVKKPLDPAKVTDQRFLELALVQAERAWSYAMELKEQEDNPRARLHAVRRLFKSTKWSHLLVKLCEQTADQRTKLEAKAYASWMYGNHSMERKEWSSARNEFVKARAVYQQLAKLGGPEQDTYNQKAEDLETTIKFCQYNLSGVQSEAELRKALNSVSEDPQFQTLRAQLEDLMGQAREKQAEALEEISWNDEKISFKNPKARGSMLSAKETMFNVNASSKLETKLELYDKLFGQYAEAIRHIKDDIAAVGQNDKGPNKPSAATLAQQRKTLQTLQNYVLWLRDSATSERNMLLVNDLEGKLESQTLDLTKVKNVNPDEIARLYETLMQLFPDIDQHLTRDAQSTQLFDSKMLSYKALRCYYMALSFVQGSKWQEASALLSRSKEHLTKALLIHKECKNPDKVVLARVDKLEGQIKAYVSFIQAKAAQASQAGPQEQTQQSVPFDLALASLQRPDLTDKKKAPRGWLGFW